MSEKKALESFNDEELELFMQQLGSELFITSWVKIRNYLRDNVRNNDVREFRISFQDDEHFIIHPLNKDGETIDMNLSGLPVD